MDFNHSPTINGITYFSLIEKYRCGCIYFSPFDQCCQIMNIFMKSLFLASTFNYNYVSDISCHIRQLLH